MQNVEQLRRHDALHRVLLNTMLFAACGMTVGSVSALGLGGMRVHSGLGQPLHVTIALQGADNGDTPTSCYKARLDSADGAFLHAARVALTPSARPTQLIVTTSQNINEPAAQLRVEFTCGAHLQRDYQMLLDPPELAAMAEINPPVVAPPTTAAAAPVAPRRVRAPVPSAGSDATSAATTPTAVTTPRPPRRKPQSRPVAPTDMPKAPVTAAKKQGTAGAATTPSAAPRSVLKLSNSELLDPAPAAVTAAPVATPAPTAEMAALQSRIDALEAESAKLRLLTAQYDLALKAANAASAAAAIRKQEESASSYWLVGLGLLLLLCLAAIGWLAWRMRELKAQTAAAWSSSVPNYPPADNIDDDAALFADTAPPAFMPPAPAPETATAHDPAAAAEAAIRAVYSGKPVPEIRNTEPEKRAPDDIFENSLSPLPFIADDGALRLHVVQTEMPKAEEILDKMQEAEFWISLQNSEMAIEVLESYESEGTPESPLPWLYLLDLYRGVGDKQKYDHLRERFRHSFNGNVPEWGIQLASEARSLEDYPHLMDRISSLWHTSEVLPFLQRLLTDDREGVRGGFDLPGYRDILFLIGLASEMRDTPVTSGS